MDKKTLKVLFVCTGNSCRSIMAEALLNELGKDSFKAFSAGSSPAGFVHPQALACLKRNHIPVHDPRSKTWDDFSNHPLDLLVTVCDRAAGEACPLFSGAPIKAHWGLPDPAAAEGSDTEIAEVFQAVYASLRTHLESLVAAVGTDQDSDLATTLAELGCPPPPRLP